MPSPPTCRSSRHQRDWWRDERLWPPPRDLYGPVVPFEGEVLEGWASTAWPGKVELWVRTTKGRLGLKPARLVQPSGEWRDVVVLGVPFYDGRPKDTFGPGQTLLLIDGIDVADVVPGQYIVQSDEPPPAGVRSSEQLSEWWRRQRAHES